MTTRTVSRPAGARASTPRKAATPRRPRQAPTTPASADRAGPSRAAGHAVLAAEQAMRRNSLRLRLPIVGELRLPAGQEVVFIGGIAGLAIVGLLEWPVALILGIGHTLATNRSNKVVHAFGEALEEA